MLDTHDVKACYALAESFMRDSDPFEHDKLNKYIEEGLLEAIETCVSYRKERARRVISGDLGWVLINIARELAYHLVKYVNENKKYPDNYKKLARTGVCEEFPLNGFCPGEGKNLAALLALNFYCKPVLSDTLIANYICDVTMKGKNFIPELVSFYCNELKVENYQIPNLTEDNIINSIKQRGQEVLARANNYPVYIDAVVNACTAYSAREGKSLFMDAFKGYRTTDVPAAKLQGFLVIGYRMLASARNEEERNALGELITETMFRAKHHDVEIPDDLMERLLALNNPRINACFMIRELNDTKLRSVLSNPMDNEAFKYIQTNGLNDYIRSLAMLCPRDVRMNMVLYIYGSGTKTQKRSALRYVFASDFDL